MGSARGSCRRQSAPSEVDIPMIPPDPTCVSGFPETVGVQFWRHDRTRPPRRQAAGSLHRRHLAGGEQRRPLRRPRSRRRLGDLLGGRRRAHRRDGRAGRRRRRPARLGAYGAPRTRRDPAPGLRPAHRAGRRLRPPDEPRDGQDRRRGQGRGRPTARSSSAGSPRRRCASTAAGCRLPPGQPAAHHPQAGRPLPVHHPLELPARHGHPQDRPGRRRRLHDGDQARRRDAAVDARAGRADGGGRPAAGRPQRRSPPTAHARSGPP